jgi:hypothetical protein
MFDNPSEPEKENQSFQDALGFGALTNPAPAPPPATRQRPPPGLLGLSALQRLVLALLLLVAVCVLGTMCLLITGRVSAF